MSKITKILYATDLSASAKAAFKWAMSLAEQYDASITVIHVIPDLTEEMSASAGYDLAAHFGADRLAEFNEEGRANAFTAVRERIQNVCTEMEKDFSKCRTNLNNIIIKVGHPVRNIITAAEEGGYDIVVLGTHGHGLIGDLMLGSVARGVVHKCSIPVLTVRLPPE